MAHGTWDVIEGNWKKFKGSVQERWGELTDDEFDQIQGNREQLAGKLQERYGKTRNEIDHEINKWADEMNREYNN